ncbi:hypothetical protein CONPUDRAFT_159152 [Coniophora puteana RWD-64-598 SS2]|uniref:Uncharacterized protein n=1 Tax=Coniophora puteana (strain RWD-64-598) TaxID=741705 RepID=A0A5M3M9G1_CONPW|nr:uncharacterized protein CONPUDRAFT_159152 [Coniophora puteana RWD-64-598 SS2]EIW75717.1 hypothetical protein CONPUDRAFT_159152 [Coniophora puteana RWD-64-598 SS2]
MRHIAVHGSLRHLDFQPTSFSKHPLLSRRSDICAGGTAFGKPSRSQLLSSLTAPSRLASPPSSPRSQLLHARRRRCPLVSTSFSKASGQGPFSTNSIALAPAPTLALPDFGILITRPLSPARHWHTGP